MKRYIFTLLTLLVCSSFAFSQKRDKEEMAADFKNFKGVSVSLNANVYLKQADSFSITVLGNPDQLDRLIIDVRDSVLRFRMDNDYSIRLRDYERYTIYISAPQYSYLSFSGMGKAYSDNKLTGSTLTVLHNGAHDIDLDIDYDKISAEMGGMGNITLRGKVNYADLDMTGMGSIDAYDLTIQNGDCRVSGMGSINCYVENELEAKLSGMGSIRYRGKPKQLYKSVKGLGSISRR